MFPRPRLLTDWIELLPSRWRAIPRRERGAALIAVILFHVLLIYLLLSLAPKQFRPPGGEQIMTMINLLPAKPVEKARPKPVKKQARAAKAAAARPAPSTDVDLSSLLIPGLEHFDLAKVPSISTTPAPAEQTAAADSGDSPSVPAPPGFPGDGRLYVAEWVREPTNAELSFYMKSHRQSGWAMIACQTAARFRVENCRELAESPGSGLARGLSEAAWQFLVRPPRIDGRALIGAWVRIRIDFTVNEVRTDAPVPSDGLTR